MFNYIDSLYFIKDAEERYSEARSYLLKHLTPGTPDYFEVLRIIGQARKEMILGSLQIIDTFSNERQELAESGYKG